MDSLLRAAASETAGNVFLPTYHFTSPTGRDCMPFDPNGAVFHRGRYHLGYIFQEDGRHFWGHVSSADLLHWRRHPPMLTPVPEGGIFSGNAFLDKQGRVVLSYHGLGNDDPKVDAGNCLAVAQDEDLNVFSKLAANPVMKNPGWDPHTWFEDDIAYSISGSNPGITSGPSLYVSTDDSLSKWDLLGPLMSRDLPDVFPEEDISCPDLFRLGEKHILLCISHSRGARYYVGRFEHGLAAIHPTPQRLNTPTPQFHPEAHFRMNWPGGACFAPETLLDDRGRRLMWAWALGSPSTMTLPRELSMGDDGALRIEPAEELNRLRQNLRTLQNIRMEANTEQAADVIQGRCMELCVRIEPQNAVECGVKVFCSHDGSEQTAIVYVPTRKVLRIEMDRSSLDRSALPRTYTMTFMLPNGAENPVVSAQEAPFELKPGERLDLHIYLDHSILEVFANGRQCLTQRVWPTRADSVGIRLFSRGGGMVVESLEAWEMSALVLGDR